MKHRPHADARYDKVDEIPFDFNRKLPSVAVRADDVWRPARTKGFVRIGLQLVRR